MVAIIDYHKRQWPRSSTDLRAGVISQEVERFAGTPADDVTVEASPIVLGRTKSQLARESASAAAGATLVPRMPKQPAASETAGNRTVAEPWDVDKKTLQQAAFESLLLCLSTDAAQELDEIYNTATGSVRLQMNVSRRQCHGYEMMLELPTQIRELDLAAVRRQFVAQSGPAADPPASSHNSC